MSSIIEDSDDSQDSLSLKADGVLKDKTQGTTFKNTTSPPPIHGKHSIRKPLRRIDPNEGNLHKNANEMKPYLSRSPDCSISRHCITPNSTFKSLNTSLHLRPFSPSALSEMSMTERNASTNETTTLPDTYSSSASLSSFFSDGDELNSTISSYLRSPEKQDEEVSAFLAQAKELVQKYRSCHHGISSSPKS